VQLGDDVARSLGRHENSVPEGVGGILQSGLRGRRHVRQGGGPLRRAHRERDDLAIVDQGQRWSDRQEIEIDAAGHGFGQRLNRSAERHMLRSKTRADAKAFGGEM
jgi:hypothetical protein